MKFFFSMKISELYNIFKQFPKVITDSRNVFKDSLFFALKGENFNGNEYANDAIKKGCKYAIIDEAKYKLNEYYILVDNVLTFWSNYVSI